MERAGNILGKSKSASKFLSREDLAHAAWRAAAGKRLASQTRPGVLCGQRLVVEVEDEVWSSQLSTLRPEFLRKIAAIQPGVLTDLEFRVVPRRRMPARDERPVRHAAQKPVPLSERIEDPFLSRIYQASRHRALA